MSPWLKLTLVACAIIAGLASLHFLALWMESRGWIYYRKPRPKSSAGAVLNVFYEIVKPEIRHVIEDRDQRHVEDTDREAGPPGGRRIR